LVFTEIVSLKYLVLQADEGLLAVSHSLYGEMAYSIGFAWQSFGSGEATGMAFWRSCQQPPPCPIEPILADFKTDPLLAKAEPVSAVVAPLE